MWPLHETLSGDSNSLKAQTKRKALSHGPEHAPQVGAKYRDKLVDAHSGRARNPGVAA